jgi:pentatricopeptide repeat protein
MRTYEYMVRCLARSGYLNSAMKTLREMRGMTHHLPVFACFPFLLHELVEW